MKDQAREAVQEIAQEMLAEIDRAEAGINAGDWLIAHQVITYELGGDPGRKSFEDDDEEARAIEEFDAAHEAAMIVFERDLHRMASGDVSNDDVSRFCAVPFLGTKGQRRYLEAENRMSGGELQTAREYLGLTLDAFAAIIGVRQDTLRKWEAGKDPVPYRLWEEVEQIEAYTADVVGKVVAGLHDMRDPEVGVYRTDEEFRAAQPNAARFTARWWRHVVARAVTEVPGTVITDM